MEEIVGVFGQSMSIFNSNHVTSTWKKENYPEKSVIYLNQGYLRVKDNKKMYYMDFHILGQIKKCINPPEDIQNYVCKEIEVKMYRPRYDPVSCQFLDLYESLGVIVVKGDYSEHFLD